MCEGREQHKSPGGSRRPEEMVPHHPRPTPATCELCESQASVYCQADDAFLCRKCDKWVHGANFLAQRHIRCVVCTACRGLTQRYLIGTSSEVTLPAIVSGGGGNRCDSTGGTDCSKSLKMPFLFL